MGINFNQRMMKKQELIEKYLSEPYKPGDKVYVKGKGSQNKNAWLGTSIIKSVHEDHVLLTDSWDNIKSFEDLKKITHGIGANPFPERDDYTRSVNFTLESVLFQLGLTDRGMKDDRYKTKKGFDIKACNFNPYVVVGGIKQYYQRPLVWSVNDKQLLIESLYNNITCGKILVRKRSFNECDQMEEGECFFYDIVDGKQRLNAIVEFLNDKFTDLHGNLFSELSDEAQRRLTDHQLISYAEMPEDTPDEDVLKQFLRMNFSGVPQSQEHLDYVKSLL